MPDRDGQSHRPADTADTDDTAGTGELHAQPLRVGKARRRDFAIRNRPAIGPSIRRRTSKRCPGWQRPTTRMRSSGSTHSHWHHVIRLENANTVRWIGRNARPMPAACPG